MVHVGPTDCQSIQQVRFFTGHTTLDYAYHNIFKRSKIVVRLHGTSCVIYLKCAPSCNAVLQIYMFEVLTIFDSVFFYYMNFNLSPLFAL